ncbi:MAG: DUF2127 domain-containing protein [Paracoccaceae bacterium]
MRQPRRLPPERGLLHRLFEGGLTLKALMGVGEAGVGAALLLLGYDRVRHWIDAAIRWEVIEDRDSPLLRWIALAVGHLGPGTEHFYALYLLGHGVTKLVMVGLLWARLAIAYPAAMAIQSGFIVFELHRWTASHNPVLLGLAALDAAILVLIWHEWQAARTTGPLPRA